MPWNTVKMIQMSGGYLSGVLWRVNRRPLVEDQIVPVLFSFFTSVGNIFNRLSSSFYYFLGHSQSGLHSKINVSVKSYSSNLFIFMYRWAFFLSLSLLNFSHPFFFAQLKILPFTLLKRNQDAYILYKNIKLYKVQLVWKHWATTLLKW